MFALRAHHAAVGSEIYTIPGALSPKRRWLSNVRAPPRKWAGVRAGPATPAGLPSGRTGLCEPLRSRPAGPTAGAAEWGVKDEGVVGAPAPCRALRVWGRPGPRPQACFLLGPGQATRCGRLPVDLEACLAHSSLQSWPLWGRPEAPLASEPPAGRDTWQHPGLHTGLSASPWADSVSTPLLGAPLVWV